MCLNIETSSGTFTSLVFLIHGWPRTLQYYQFRITKRSTLINTKRTLVWFMLVTNLHARKNHQDRKILIQGKLPKITSFRWLIAPCQKKVNMVKTCIQVNCHGTILKSNSLKVLFLKYNFLKLWWDFYRRRKGWQCKDIGPNWSN